METEFTSLVENAFDFVERSMDDLEAGRPKYSVINFYSGVELFLKARLLKEHWALCASNVSKMAKSDFASGGFESIGLNDAKDRLSNIVGCAIPKAESSVYEKLRKRRNQAVHFYHPDDLRSEKKVAVEQLSGWHFLRKRLGIAWQDCFEPWTERIATLHRRMIGREDYYPVIFDEMRSEIEAHSKGRLRSECPTCRHPSALTQGKALGDVHRMECLVCETENFVVFLPCQCGKLAPRSYEHEAECQWCGKTKLATTDEAFNWAEKGFTQTPAAWCGVCGFMPKPSVIEVDSKSLCLACFTYEEHSGVCRCGWCGDSVTGEIGDRINPGCIRCGFHIETEADNEPTLENWYLNEVSTWQQHREWMNERG